MSCGNNNNKSEWTKTITLRLLELLEERPCLYDPRNKFYSNKHARVNALTMISEKLIEEFKIEISSDEVKKKIANLRSQFNHELA
ncbi:unnamed protein product [Tenebrio molitor]|jgi:hypothetical protein|nr:unnamed protein product [Tenebrio molitor]